ncbi:MAG: hypothetical protein JNM25_01380 [Planctomycetes bacterium]|nr:hypothetical protein [Planctomycetota bacterium]
MRTRLAATLLLLCCQPLTAQAPGAGPTPTPASATGRGGIAWFGTWQQGLAEARRTGRPILLMAATPQCHGVPGVW